MLIFKMKIYKKYIKNIFFTPMHFIPSWQRTRKQRNTKWKRRKACEPSRDTDHTQVRRLLRSLWLKATFSNFYFYSEMQHLKINRVNCLRFQEQANHTIVEFLCVFRSLSMKTNYLMSHLQPATRRQLGLYSQAGDVFSSGIYSPHCCPARKTSSHSPAAPKVK